MGTIVTGTAEREAQGEEARAGDPNLKSGCPSQFRFTPSHHAHLPGPLPRLPSSHLRVLNTTLMSKLLPRPNTSESLSHWKTTEANRVGQLRDIWIPLRQAECQRIMIIISRLTVCPALFVESHSSSPAHGYSSATLKPAVGIVAF